ncbi:hypothetical protein LT493_43900 [Streptomyces tricolor]|nr:hypothetical protein [Streptomyces tricolor]
MLPGGPDGAAQEPGPGQGAGDDRPGRPVLRGDAGVRGAGPEAAGRAGGADRPVRVRPVVHRPPHRPGRRLVRRT